MKERKEGDIYSYMLRFNKGLALDRQALDNIEQFRDMTDMTMRDAILLILATADISTLHDSILSLNVIPKKDKSQGRNREKGREKNLEKRQEKDSPQSLQKRVEEKEYDKEPKNEDKPEPVLDSVFATIFDNF